MASEDVIELGSSDDEAEPATKKIKPFPNAMVHIPTKLHGVTIKPAKKSVPGLPKELAGKNVTVTKISKGNVLANPYALKMKANGKPVQPKHSTAQQPAHNKFTQILKKPIPVQNIINRPINPLSAVKKNNSQIVINKVPTKSPLLKNQLIRIQSPQAINSLPASITVTRTSGGQKRVAPTTVTSAVRKKQKLNSKPKKTMPAEVLTVDLDDDDVSTTSSSNPQWYLRPEEQTSVLEEQNNKEPEPKSETAKFIEITIEDSPVKPVQGKRTNEVGAEFTVTIDDSPVKTVVEKNIASGSDSEVRPENKVPHSKKKLDYPKEAEASKTIEIEISPLEVPKETAPSSNENSKKAEASINDNIIEIEESPMKLDGQATSTPKKNHPKPQLEVPESLKEFQKDNELSEFHPVYQNFIKLCFELENSDDMKKIVEKKIKTYYRQVPKEYTESEEFIDMVSGKILSMKAGPEKMYLYIKDIVDELNLQRKMAKSQVLSSITEKKAAVSEADKFLYGEESEYDSKRQRQIRQLEKTLKKLHRAIQKLEEQEVDFDDDEDSVYLLTESDDGSTSNKDSDKQLEKDPKALLQRYKERMVRVHAKFCQLTNTKMPSEPRVQIDPRPGQPAGPAKRLEKWINKKVPIGTPLPFPDFHDVLRCVRDANTEDKLGWNEADIMEEARDLFTRCGKKLQRRRQENEWRLAASRISVDIDPAEESNELKKKLDDNKKLAAKKETDVFNKFADRQSQLKLEAEEIGDKEAEESPADDDEEDEPNEKESLENTEKRKERLKRLLHEKSKKGSNEQKTVTIIDATDSQTGDEQASDQKTDAANETKKQETEQEELTEKQETNKSSEKNTEHMDEDIEMVSKEVETAHENGPNQKEEIIDKDSGSPVAVTNTIFIENNDNKTEDAHIPINNKATSDNTDKTHLISDDSSKLESDVDELHLLQKLHSESEANTSTQETSDSESPIAISDTLESSSDNKKHTASDVISIENSSYSESEIHIEPSNTKGDSKETDPLKDKVVAETVDENTEIECSNVGVEKKLVRTNNDEYNESIEDILLASSDDEGESDKNVKSVNNDECINLKDDSISIGDTVVEGVEKAGINPTTDEVTSGKQDDASSVESVSCVSSKGNSPIAMDVDCNEDKSVEKPNASHVSEEVATQKQDKIEPSNENSCDQTIELKESSPEEIRDTTDKSNDSSDCQKSEQLVVTSNVNKAKSSACEIVQNKNVEHSNDSSSAKV